MSGPAVAETTAELRKLRDELPGPVVLVPTMGALHEGHRALVRAARRYGGSVVVSVFVNPTQFAPGEDFGRYPRTWDADLAALDNGLRRGDRGLTGPVSRGDVGTVRQHVDTLTERAPASVAAYVAMAQRTTERALAAGRLRAADGAPLLELLSGDPEEAAR